MTRIRSSNYGAGRSLWAERDGKVIATIHCHPNWRRDKLPDAWNVCWTTGRVDWHSTLAEARDNALEGL